jgi:hypothetical protein
VYSYKKIHIYITQSSFQEKIYVGIYNRLDRPVQPIDLKSIIYLICLTQIILNGFRMNSNQYKNMLEIIAKVVLNRAGFFFWLLFAMPE